MKLALKPWIALTASVLVLLGTGLIQPTKSPAPEPVSDLDRQIVELNPSFLAKHGNRFFHGMSLTTFRTEAMSLAITENFRVKSAILNVNQVDRHDGGRDQSLTFGYLPNLPGEPNLQLFNNFVDAEVLQLVKQHAKDTGTKYVPEAKGLPEKGLAKQCGGTIDLVSGRERADLHHKKPLLLADCEVVLASGSMFAERMSVFIADGTDNQQTDRIFYADLGALLPNQDSGDNEKMAGDFSALVTDYDSFLTDVQLLIADRLLDGNAESVVSSPDDLVTLDQVRKGVERAVFSDAGDLIVPIESTALQRTSDRLPMVVQHQDSGFRMFAISSEIVTKNLNNFGQRVAAAASDQVESVLNIRSSAGHAHVNCSIVPCLAITFDDGPMGKKTEGVLAALAKYDQATTFFVMGTRAAKDPKMLQKMVNEGHEVGGHTWNHPVLTSLDDKDLKKQFKKTDQAIKKAIGKNPIYYRPPYGMWSHKVLKASGQAAILWNVDSDDWRGDPDKKYLDRSFKVSPGDIVLFHDVQPQTVKNIDKMVAEYTARGYSLVTISQLFQDKPLKAGSLVYSR